MVLGGIFGLLPAVLFSFVSFAEEKLPDSVPAAVAACASAIRDAHEWDKLPSWPVPHINVSRKREKSLLMTSGLSLGFLARLLGGVGTAPADVLYTSFRTRKTTTEPFAVDEETTRMLLTADNWVGQQPRLLLIGDESAAMEPVLGMAKVNAQLLAFEEQLPLRVQLIAAGSISAILARGKLENLLGNDVVQTDLLKHYLKALENAGYMALSFPLSEAELSKFGLSLDSQKLVDGEGKSVLEQALVLAIRRRIHLMLPDRESYDLVISYGTPEESYFEVEDGLMGARLRDQSRVGRGNYRGIAARGQDIGVSVGAPTVIIHIIKAKAPDDSPIRRFFRWQ